MRWPKLIVIGGHEVSWLLTNRQIDCHKPILDVLLGRMKQVRIPDHTMRLRPRFSTIDGKAVRTDLRTVPFIEMQSHLKTPDESAAIISLNELYFFPVIIF